MARFRRGRFGSRKPKREGRTFAYRVAVFLFGPGPWPIPAGEPVLATYELEVPTERAAHGPEVARMAMLHWVDEGKAIENGRIERRVERFKIGWHEWKAMRDNWRRWVVPGVLTDEDLFDD